MPVEPIKVIPTQLCFRFTGERSGFARIAVSLRSATGEPLVDLGEWTVPQGGTFSVSNLFALPQFTQTGLDVQLHLLYDPDELSLAPGEGSLPAAIHLNGGVAPALVDAGMMPPSPTRPRTCPLCGEAFLRRFMRCCPSCGQPLIARKEGETDNGGR